jgi:hypothetical protein
MIRLFEEFRGNIAEGVVHVDGPSSVAFEIRS